MGEKHPLKIESLSMEGGADWLLYSRGHHGRGVFTAAVREGEFQTETEAVEVEHQYWRCIPNRGREFDPCCSGQFGMYWWRARAPGPGAMPVTVWMARYGPELGYVDEMNG